MMTRNAYLRSMALGWRALSFLGIGYLSKQFLMTLSGTMYSPLVGAYFRKYSNHIKTDLYDIKDAKKEYFYIDTSEYMNYSNASMSDEYHCHHGPQPVSPYTFIKLIKLLYRMENHSIAHGCPRWINSSEAKKITSRTTRDTSITISHISIRASQLPRPYHP